MEFLQHPVVKGAIAGLLSAASADFMAFRAWKSFDEALEYKWGLAVFRWAQGAAIGAASAFGLGAAA